MGAIYLDDVKCYGSETHILECSQLPLDATNNCDHSEDATVACTGELIQLTGVLTVNACMCIFSYSYCINV